MRNVTCEVVWEISWKLLRFSRFENISLLEMELQVVPPSVWHPPMKEKAIRAWKKYLRNARERSRKILGMKILQHVFKKLK